MFPWSVVKVGRWRAVIGGEKIADIGEEWVLFLNAIWECMRRSDNDVDWR